MLVDSGESKGYVIQVNQVDLATAYVGMVDETGSCLINSGTKKDMVLKPPMTVDKK
jgi:hypothetical protein